MSKAITTIDKTNMLATDIEREVKQTTRKLMRLAPGGRRLNGDQAVDLAVRIEECSLVVGHGLPQFEQVIGVSFRIWIPYCGAAAYPDVIRAFDFEILLPTDKVQIEPIAAGGSLRDYQGNLVEVQMVGDNSNGSKSP